MTCQGCVRSVTRAVEGLGSNVKAQVDLASGRVDIQGDVDADNVRRAIEEAGFTVKSPDAAR